MNDPEFKPGFRFSSLDGMILALGTVFLLGLALFDGWLGLAAAFVLLHFFVFCNIVRMSRPAELIWAGGFAAMCILVTADVVSWPFAFGVSCLLSIMLILIAIRSPSYHGLGWSKWNPHLPEWWHAHRAGKA